MKTLIIAILCVSGIAVAVIIKHRSNSGLSVFPIKSGDHLADASMNEEAQVLRFRFAKFGREREPANAVRLYVKIPDPIKPLERWKKYEEPLATALHEKKLGTITGGGSMRQKDGTIEYCGIDLAASSEAKAVAVIKAVMHAAGAPKGTQIEYLGSNKVVAILE